MKSCRFIVFVDTEHGINTAIRKIRAALRDDAERSRYIQTVSGKGYRFIGEITGNGTLRADGLTPEQLAANPLASIPEQSDHVRRAKHSGWKWAGIAAAIFVLLVDARKALALDESLPDVHNTLAAIYLFRDWDWPSPKQNRPERLR